MRTKCDGRTERILKMNPRAVPRKVERWLSEVTWEEVRGQKSPSQQVCPDPNTTNSERAVYLSLQTSSPDS